MKHGLHAADRRAETVGLIHIAQDEFGAGFAKMAHL